LAALSSGWPDHPDCGCEEEDEDDAHEWRRERADEYDEKAYGLADGALDGDELGPVDVEDVKEVDEGVERVRPAHVYKVPKHPETLAKADGDLCVRRKHRAVPS
jgi:hypothetical protein